MTSTELAARHRYPDPGPITFDMATDTGPHRITWHAGRLILHDHTLAAERVMRTFGGDSCPCLLVFDTLAARTADVSGFRFDGAVLADERRILQNLDADNGYLAMPPDQRAEVLYRARHRLVTQLVPQRMAAVLDHVREVQSLRRPTPPSRAHRPALAGLLQDAAEPAVRCAIQAQVAEPWRSAPLLIECWPQRSGQSRLLHAQLTKTAGHLVVSLSGSWLNRVWRRGLSVVDNRFVLGVNRPAPATDLSGEVLEWIPGEGCLLPVVVPARLRRYPGGWRLIERSTSIPGTGGSLSKS